MKGLLGLKKWDHRRVGGEGPEASGTDLVVQQVSIIYSKDYDHAEL